MGSLKALPKVLLERRIHINSRKVLRKILMAVTVAVLLTATIGSGVSLAHHGDPHVINARERDSFPNSMARVEVMDPMGNLLMLTLNGPTVVGVDIGPNGEAMDSNGNGRNEVPTEILSMNLMGISPMGIVDLRLRDPAMHPFKATIGEIKENANATAGILDLPPFTATGMADSFFDVFFEIDVPGFGTLHNDDPVHVVAIITHKPPGLGETYFHIGLPPGGLPLFTEDEQDSGFRLTGASHTPNLDELPTPTPTPTPTPPKVGGIAEFTVGGSGSSAGGTAVLAGSAAAFIALVGGGWYARRRWHGRR